MHNQMTSHLHWQSRPTTSTQSRLLSLPKEILLEIVSSVAIDSNSLFPIALLELSQCCKYLYHLVHKDPWRQQTLWPRAFHHRFDTGAIYRRRLDQQMNWQYVLERRCRALNQCKKFAINSNRIELLDAIDWEVIWDVITEHDQYNIPHLMNFQVHYAAGIAFQLGSYRDREIYPVVLPILSILVNYDFSITRFFTSENSAIVSNELSQFAYNFEADALITQHTPLRYFHSWSSPMDHQQHQQTISNTSFYPAQDPLASAFHLFFTTIFANHPNIHQAIPGCIPIPLYTLTSELFDVEFLRRYERNLFFASLQESRQGWEEKQHHVPFSPSTTSRLNNIYAESGFASASQFVSEAHLIEGEWIGYYTFQDPDDAVAAEENNRPMTTATTTTTTTITTNNTTTPTNTALENASAMEDWFDGPMRITIKIVPLEDASGEPISQSSWLSRWLDDETPQDANMTEPRKRRKTNNNNLVETIQNASSASSSSASNQFPYKHLKACPLTRFEGTGVDNLGTFSITGLVDDTEEGQVTWEKNYIDSGETWEYSGRFAWPMGLCGRWGDEEYGGPWWMWKVADKDAASTTSTVTK